MSDPSYAIALEGRLKKCRNVITLGVKPNWEDYCFEDRQRILNAGKIYYPSAFYVELFHLAGKKTFPSRLTYHFAQDKIRQTTAFYLAGIPHPRTRFFFGERQKKSILEYFKFPFIAKVARGSALGCGVFLIQSQEDLNRYLEMSRVAYIQEYLPVDRDIRVVVIGHQVRLAYWRINATGDFRSNVFQGGCIKLDAVPEEAKRLALHAALHCGWDDVGIDILSYAGKYYVLEANMKYGRQGFSAAGIDYHQLMEQLIENGGI